MTKRRAKNLESAAGDGYRQVTVYIAQLELALITLINACDSVIVNHFDTDSMSESVTKMRVGSMNARDVLLPGVADIELVAESCAGAGMITIPREVLKLLTHDRFVHIRVVQKRRNEAMG